MADHFTEKEIAEFREAFSLGQNRRAWLSGKDTGRHVEMFPANEFGIMHTMDR